MARSRWLIIELSEHGESASYEQLDNALFHILGPEVDYFIPIRKEVMGTYVSTSILFDNYVFVKDCCESRKRFDEVRDCKYFLKILNTNGKTNTIDSHTIGALKRRLGGMARRRFIIGSKVKILGGIFQNMPGEVLGLEDRGKKAVVRVKTYSREIIAPMPSTNIMEIPEGELDYS